jgi:site-specific recombinase XerD
MSQIGYLIDLHIMNHTAQNALSELLTHIDGAYAPNTIRAYKADMLEFIQYCAQTNIAALPANPLTVSDFLQSTSTHGIKNSTISRKVSSISAVHRLLNHIDPTKHPEVKITLRKISRQLGNRFDQAYPVTRELLGKLIKVCKGDIRGLRNKALLLLAYDSMRRRSELISLRIEDINWLPSQNCCVLLRRSKTDQQGSGKWIHLTVETTLAIKCWLDAANLSEGAILRGIKPNGLITSSLCESRIPRIYKSLARLAVLNKDVVSGISGHSMRVGAAQDLLRLGASLPQIMAKGGWSKTDTVMRYVERSPANLWPIATNIAAQ